MSQKENSNAQAQTETADDGYCPPPPSYEEAMGVYQTSVKPAHLGHVTTDQSELAYIDLMPRCVSPGDLRLKYPPRFETFSSILSGANQWLRNNPGYRVWKCETLERKLNSALDGTISYQLVDMLQHDAIFGFCVYIRGLRLWLQKSVQPGAPPQVIGLRNVEPAKKTVRIQALGHYSGRLLELGDAMIGAIGDMNLHQYAGLQDTVVEANRRLVADPIPGSILTMETESLKAYEGGQFYENDPDPDSTCWSEDKINFRRIIKILRIFYVYGPPANEQIAVEDFVPDITRSGDLVSPPKLAAYSNTLDKVNQWLPKHPDKRIVNFQQCDARIETKLGNVTITTDSMDERVTFHDTRHLARAIRLFYVTNTSHAVPSAPSYVTSRVFLPVRTGPKSFEDMVQTMARVDAWLRLAGVPILNVETVRFLYNEHQPEGADVTQGHYFLHGICGKLWVTAIRVYFPCAYMEPHTSPFPEPLKAKNDNECVVM